jgi:chromosome segregation ATPase
MSDNPVLAAIGRLEIAFAGSQRDVRADISQLREDQTGMRGDITLMRGDITQLREDQTGMRADITLMRGDITQLREDQTGMRADITQMRADITQMRSVLMDRIDRLQDRITEVRDDIGVAMGSADAMQRANDNTRELVRLQGEQMSIMFRQIKRLEDKVRTITGDP